MLYLISIGAIAFDLLIGDPKYLLHPVQIIGFYIKKTTYIFISVFKKNFLILGGAFIAISSIFLSYVVGKYIELIYLNKEDNFWLGAIIFIGISSCLATNSLISSVSRISKLIEKSEKNKKNKQLIIDEVQKIVSRDVSLSSDDDLIRSTTESLTENSVDGIFGPIFWIFLGIILIQYSDVLPGPLSLGFSYKAISTLDSMIGYKHSYYKYLGLVSAKIEDYATFIPSRLVLITLPLVSKEISNYLSLIKQAYHEGIKYDSPNSGISESIFAFVVNVKLGGVNKYFNNLEKKPILNFEGDKCSVKSIKIICNLILKLELLWILIFTFIFLLIRT